MKRFIFHLIIATALFGVFPSALFAGTFTLLADKTEFAIGDQFNVDIKIDSENVGINAAQATLVYPVSILEITGIDKTSSVFNFWLEEPAFNNTTGKVSFIGGSLSGLDGKTLQVVRVSFRVVGTGEANVSFADGAITASDGNGTNVLSLMKGLTLSSISKKESTLIPSPAKPLLPPAVAPIVLIKRPAVPTGKLPVKPTVSVPLYPVSGLWYNELSPFLASWMLPADVTSVVTELNKKPVSEPKVSEGLFDNKTFQIFEDGIWYLHVRFKNDVGFGPTTNYKIGIDTVPPLPFTVVSQEGNDTRVTAPTIFFETKDQPSGIAFYRIIIDGKEATGTPATTYTLPSQEVGKHAVIVSAEDFAGNKTSTLIPITIQEHPFVVVGAFSLTQFQFFAGLILFLLVIFAVWWFSYRRWKRQLFRRVFVAEGDVGHTFTSVENDTEKIIDILEDTPEKSKDVAEAEFLARKIKEKMGKAQKYVIDNMREISKK